MNVTINLLFSSINYNVNKHVLIFTNGHLYSSKILCSRPAAGREYKHFIFIPAGAVPVYKFNFINSIFWTVSIQIFAIFSWAWLIPPHHCMWTILNFKSEFWLQLLGVSIVQLKTGFVILYYVLCNIKECVPLFHTTKLYDILWNTSIFALLCFTNLWYILWWF